MKRIEGEYSPQFLLHRIIHSIARISMKERGRYSGAGSMMRTKLFRLMKKNINCLDPFRISGAPN